MRNLLHRLLIHSLLEIGYRRSRARLRRHLSLLIPSLVLVLMLLLPRYLDGSLSMLSCNRSVSGRPIGQI